MAPATRPARSATARLVPVTAADDPGRSGERPGSSAAVAPPGAARDQRGKNWLLLASVRSSSRIAGLLVRARALSSARRVRAAWRRCRQLDVTLLISAVPFHRTFKGSTPVVKQANPLLFRRNAGQLETSPMISPSFG